MGVQETGNEDDIGTKNKYRRMGSQLTDNGDDDLEDVQQRQQERSREIRKYIFACAVFASLNHVLLGYDVGVMSGAIIFIQEDLNITELQEEILICSLSVISILGSLAGGRISDGVGRKWSMGLAAIIFQIGALTMTLAPTFEFLMIGRLVSGVGIGFGSMIAPVYITEISPAVSRGTFSSFPEILINLGILLGYVSNYAFSGLPSYINWRIMLAVGSLPAIFIGFGICVILESPRWLVMQNRIDEARTVLINTNEIEAEAEERLSEILASANAGLGNAETTVWRELVNPTPVVRRMLVTGIGLMTFQQISGIDAIVYYSPEILQTVGLEDKSKLLAATVAVRISKTMFILVVILVIDKVGRKPLLYVSTVGMTFCLFGLGITLWLFNQGSIGIALVILLVCGNVAFFSVGIGPICVVMPSEIFPLRLRAQGYALGVVGNRLCSGIVSMSFLSVSHAISMVGTFFLFSTLSALFVVFVYKLVPETKGKSLEQIEILFRNDQHDWQDDQVEFSDSQVLLV